MLKIACLVIRACLLVELRESQVASHLIDSAYCNDNIKKIKRPRLFAYCVLIAYNNNFITTEYGIINGYVYALLLLPSFFTMAISNALLPSLFHYDI